MDSALLFILLIIIVAPALYWLSDIIAKLFRKWDDYSERAEAREAEEVSRPQSKEVTKNDVIINAVLLVLWQAVVVWIVASSDLESSGRAGIIIFLLSLIFVSRLFALYDLYKQYRRQSPS